MTEGRCFLPGFDEDCKDGGSETKEWVKREGGRGRGGGVYSYSFYEGSHDHTRPDTGSALAAALEIVAVFPQLKPECRANTSSGSSYFTFSHN